VDPQVGLIDETDEYMKWYRRITRRFISPMGALIDAMVCILSSSIMMNIVIKFMQLGISY
jgi:hypothetical protein